MNEFMKKACEQANYGVTHNEGGPFGAVLVKDNQIIAQTNNTVILSKDPTAHAEVNAIREASKKLNTYNLEGCTLYTTSEPCPMCMSAIIWANIKDVYYGTNRFDVAKTGFRDQSIYDYLADKETNVVNKIELDKEQCQELLNNYNNTIY